ncbi:MAG: ketopantoate reductase family protein [Betaproteobacteria bacterium]|nr:ketopantoate reductase family protein [Betaproteobacteria bacterium]
MRERRKAQLDRDGLCIESPQGDAQLQVTSILQSDTTTTPDLVLLTCKAYDLIGAIESIRPFMGPNSAVLPLLNGIAHMDRLNREFGQARVLGGTIRMQATLTPTGLIRQLNDWQTLTFGEQDGQRHDRLLAFQSALQPTGIEAKLSASIMHELWMKLVHLATVATGTCLMRANIGEIARTPQGTQWLNRLLQLNADIASHAGYPPDDAFLEGYRKLFATRDATYEASMLRDLEKGGPVEAEQIVGFMLEQCRTAGQDDALHLAAYTHLKAYEQRRDAGRLPQP